MSDPSRVRVSGPLLEYVPGFREELVRQGYGPDSATGQLQLMANLSRWLGSQGLGAGELTPARVVTIPTFPYTQSSVFVHLAD